MVHLTRVVESFPTAEIRCGRDNLPVEVSLIAQLGHGAGNHLLSHVVGRQKNHAEFIDELDEPSAKLGGTNFDLGDTTSLYSFVVGPKGHPFHRHAGHRIFTAISGSGGAQLRFSSASDIEIKKDAQNFVKAMQFINIPPDCLFTVRFGGEIWHQFAPLSPRTLHPVFFALSCHTDELGGNLSDDLKEKIKRNDADIPSLTELLPDNVTRFLHSKEFQASDVPTTTLSLDAAAGTLHRKVCDTFRSNMGIIRAGWAQLIGTRGYVSKADPSLNVEKLLKMPDFTLLHKHLNEGKLHHEDMFMCKVQRDALKGIEADKILELILEGFLMNPPRGVSRLMLLRNVMVKPIGLRTSPLGCPVSSLLSQISGDVFAGKYPVWDQEITENRAQVVLGADDKHLQFRSCVSVVKEVDGTAFVYLGTRVHCKNWFGRFYMGAIDAVHRRYISPAILKGAVDFCVTQISNFPRK